MFWILGVWLKKIRGCYFDVEEIKFENSIYGNN